MDNFNKVISFILGLVVVIVFFAVITGRLNLRGRIPLLTKSATPTATPTPISTVKISPTPASSNQSYNRYQKTPSTIPATGSPTVLLPILVSSLIAGLRLKTVGKK